MSITPALAVLSIQGVLGAYDNFRNHEFREGLPLRSRQRGELALHAAREAAYCILFPTMAWLEWHGWLAWLFAAIIIGEVGITCWDFVEEDRTRKLSVNERVLHTILTLSYGAFLALLFPELIFWAQKPVGLAVVDRGVWSWLMSIYSLGVLVFGIREASAAIKLRKQATTPAATTPHRACTDGLNVAPALGALHSEARLRRAQGTAEVQIGAWPARLALRAIGLDMTTGSQAINVTFEPDGQGELWHRTFATGCFTSRFERDPRNTHGLIELYGPFAFRYELMASDGRIDWRLCQARLFGMILPRILAPRISAAEWIDQHAQYQMKTSVSLPLLGRALSYQCSLSAAA